MKALSIKLFLFIFISLHVATSTAKDGGYNLKVRIAGVKDTVCYLANYYGDKQYIRDTARVDANGRMTFMGDDELEGGIYIIALPDKKNYFEIIINKEQSFSIETDTTDLIKNMKFKGSPENVLFYAFQNFIQEKHKEVAPLREALKKAKDDEEAAKTLREQIKKIDDEVINYKLNLIKNNPETFLAKVHKASQEIDVPEAPLLSNGRKDSTFGYRYYKAHFWDNVDLTDGRLLRTPIFHNKLKQYFDKLVVPYPDSIIKDADILVEKARPDKEMFKYIIWYLTNTYERSKVMGDDAVFVHMVEKYYMTNQAYWVSAAQLESISKRAMTLKPILLGKKAPNLIMLDSNNVPVQLYSVNARYTVVFFYDPDCGHCKTERNKLKPIYDKHKDDWRLEVFAVCSDTSMATMKKYIRDNQLNWINVNGPRSLLGDYHDSYDVYSTPLIYLLDENKMILAKRIGAEQVEDFIQKHIERQEKEKKK